MVNPSPSLLCHLQKFEGHRRICEGNARVTEVEQWRIVELMRSTAWLEANEVDVGGYVRLAFEELKVDDDGWVRSISSCPAIEPGDGCVVTGTFTHLNDDVHELTFVDSDLVLQPTGLHPLWSEDRDGWVRTHELEVGERLRSEQDPLEIATVRRFEGARQVFNLEVAADHTYLVSESAILSHNVCDGTETPHTVSGRPPNRGKTGEPNSIYEQNRRDGSRSVTYFDENGRRFSREDYGQKSPHKKIGLGPDGRAKPHEHRYQYNERGFTGSRYRELDESGKPVSDWYEE